MMKLSVSLAVAGTAAEACERFWKLDSLRQGWPAIQEVSVRYDDTVLQEADMVVEREGRLERIRIIRLRRGTDIEFFNPVPPPMLRLHRGAWRFASAGRARCLITAEREFVLAGRDGEPEEQFQSRTRSFHEALEARLRSLLESVGRQHLTRAEGA
ncbi:hypothetical protein [Myxococcus sp. RHSTA-1-4]|uniref:hypothetical protein n=1 Tax=Myxococcus sp. RHSTA-1-4 TaxID=2874601 RepID=UPI001CC15295|nr:hypothetical protein [Myxococcus sp. RHSTA-1-4]MBZ4417203.1 hypothetical protein [Myxococcus sp. RHSTA-1-4]